MPFCEICGAEKNSIFDKCGNCGAVRTVENNSIEKDIAPEATNADIQSANANSLDSTNSNAISEEVNSNTKRKIKDKAILSIIVAILIAISTLIFLGILQGRYNEAQRLLLVGDYDGAYNIYATLRTYRDSEQMTLETMYQKYRDTYNNGDYIAAIDGFYSIKGYSDSDNYYNMARYGYANQLFNDEEYSEAKEIFDDLENFSDSKSRSDECIYRWAHTLYEQESWEDAKSKFLEIGRYYQDCDAYIALCDYHIAKHSLYASDYQDIQRLIPIFNALTQYPENKECRDACGDSLFTVMKLLDAKYSNGYYSIEITKSKDSDSDLWMTYNNLWDMWGHKYWGYDERGEYGMFTYTKDGIDYIDWFEIVGFDDPCSATPATVTIKRPSTGKEYVLKRY